MLVEPQCLYELEVRSSQCCALAEEVSHNKVLRQEDMKDGERERNKESVRPREKQHSGKETGRPEHARKQS